MNETSEKSFGGDGNITRGEKLRDPFSSKFQLSTYPEHEDDFNAIHTLVGISLGLLCLLAHLGISMHRAGITQRKNTTATLIRPIVHFCLVPSLYLLIGYGVFSDGNPFNGNVNFFLHGHQTIQHLSKWFVQCCIVLQCVSIASCGGSEYNYLTTEALLSLLITTVLFPFPAHWSWNSQGWLLEKGYLDYGGVGPIYIVAASAGMVLNILSKKRSEHDHRPVNPRYMDTSVQNIRSVDMVRYKRLLKSGQNVTLATFGGILNILGSLFVQVGMMTFHEGHVVLSKESFNVIQNCLIGMTCGGIVASTISRIKTGQWSIYRLYGGMISGIVLCSAGGYFLQVWQCSLLGFLAGCTYILSRNIVLCLGIVDASEVFSTYGSMGLISLIITPAITIKHFGASEWPLRLGWNMVGAITMIGWSSTLTILAFLLLAYFDLLGQTSIFLNGIDKNQMRENNILDLDEFESKVCRCDIKKSNAYPVGDRKRPSIPSVALVNKEKGYHGNAGMLKKSSENHTQLLASPRLLKNSVSEGISEQQTEKLSMSPNPHACISPPRLVSTTSDLSNTSNFAQLEKSDKNINAAVDAPSRQNLLKDIQTSSMQLRDVPLSERYSFPSPPVEVLGKSNDMNLKKKSLTLPSEHHNGKRQNNQPSRISLRPQFKLVTGDDSDLSSLPRSPYDSPRVNQPRIKVPSINSDYDKYYTPNENIPAEYEQDSKTQLPTQAINKPDNQGDQPLTNVVISNQLKLLKPLPSSVRRPSLAVRRDVTPIEKRERYIK